jgi:selT/selW/selH-like putative selenoprotein
MKRMLETSFPGIDAVLANYPPSLPKRLLAKVVPFFQMGVVAVVVAGEHIFPMVGVMAPPPWYYSLRANKFGTIATAWLLGNAAQSFLQSTGAFEVFLNDELVGNLFFLSYVLF